MRRAPEPPKGDKPERAICGRCEPHGRLVGAVGMVGVMGGVGAVGGVE